MVKLLLGVPEVNVNLAGKYGRTPLHLACYAGTPRVCTGTPPVDPRTSAEVVRLLLGVPGIHLFRRDTSGKAALEVASGSAVASLLDEVVGVKRTYGALLLALLHGGVSRAVASDVAMHGLPSARAKAMATRMRDTWPPVQGGRWPPTQ